MITKETPPVYHAYFEALEERLLHQYSLAKDARKKGIDPSLEPEPEVTRDIPERIEKLLGPTGISERMRELEGMDRREMAFKVAGEIALGRFGHREKLDAAEQAIRTGLGILTEGVTIAPIQGIPKIEIKENTDGTRYLSIYFAGPIRPAGGTAQALSLVLADYVRKTLKLARFQPTDEKIGRLIEEVRL
ncbi:MAG: DNA polymerase II large subunit, partial [Atribacterota bacterium]